jgi:hypothetical protein
METLEKQTSDSMTKIQENPIVDVESGRAVSEQNLGHGELQVVRIREGNSMLRKLREAEMWMDRKWKIEGMGAERIPENERRPPRMVNVGEPLDGAGKY